MRSMKKLLPAVFLALTIHAQAQSRQFWFSGGVSLLSNSDLGSPAPDGAQSDTHIGNGFRVGFRFAFDSSTRFGHEIQYGYSRTTFSDSTGIILTDRPSAGMGIHLGGYNFLYYFNSANAEAKVRPFVTAGVHFSDYVLPGSAAVQGGSFKPGVNVGAGAKIRLSQLFAARFDIRQYETGKPNWNGVLFKQSGPLNQTEVSAGVGVTF